MILFAGSRSFLIVLLCFHALAWAQSHHNESLTIEHGLEMFYDLDSVYFTRVEHIFHLLHHYLLLEQVPSLSKRPVQEAESVM